MMFLTKKSNSLQKFAAMVLACNMMLPSSAFANRPVASANSAPVEGELNSAFAALGLSPASAKSEARTQSDEYAKVQLEAIAARMVTSKGGILAADESVGSAKKRLDLVGLVNTPENRQRMRQMILTVEKFKNAGIDSAVRKLYVRIKGTR